MLYDDDVEAVVVTKTGVKQRVSLWQLADVIDELRRGPRRAGGLRFGTTLGSRQKPQQPAGVPMTGAGRYRPDALALRGFCRQQ
jgi:hypothetical protein